MQRNKIWKMAAAAGSFAVLASCQAVIQPYADTLAPEMGYSVAGPEECRRLLMEKVSSAAGRERNEFYVTGEDYVPETLVIAQMFPDAVRISNTKLDEYTVDGKRYVTCRIGFEKSPEKETCAHRWEREILEKGTCLWGQKEKQVCSLCGEERVLFLPPPGHGDTDGDSLCDRCGDRIYGNEEIEKRCWFVGDTLIREIGGRSYLFTCIDDDYRNGNSDNTKCALFLCGTVIRSDTDSTDSKREIIKFGELNNYKTSEWRRWLIKNSGEAVKEAVLVNTGVNSAFLGQTAAGAYGEAAETCLVKKELPLQVMEDRLFILSLEEALRYRDRLWDVESDESSYSRGYWLRTPAYREDGSGRFVYGDMEYAVDLESGRIGPAEISDTEFGIRPAFCLPQG